MFSTAAKRPAYGARLTDDIKEGLNVIKDDVCETSGKVKEDLEGMAYDAGRKAREYVDAGEKNVSRAAHAVGTLIQEKPIQSGLVAVGIGLLLGLLLRRR